MPAKPTAGRVAVWRNLKKIGAVYLQDSVCVIPDTAPLRRELALVLERIDAGGGRYHLLPLRKPPPEEAQKLVALFVEQAAQHYQEIVENCEVNFVKEIEFERFRENFTYEEAEEIRMEFEKITTWFERVEERLLRRTEPGKGEVVAQPLRKAARGVRGDGVRAERDRHGDPAGEAPIRGSIEITAKLGRPGLTIPSTAVALALD